MNTRNDENTLLGKSYSDPDLPIPVTQGTIIIPNNIMMVILVHAQAGGVVGDRWCGGEQV